MRFHNAQSTGLNLKNLEQINWEWRKFSEFSPEALDAVYQLRQAVFVVEQNCPYQDADGKDSEAIHLLGLFEGRLVATLRLFPSIESGSNQASLGRVCTDGKVRHFGVGRAMMTVALDYFDRYFPQKSLLIAAQSYLEAFYAGFGFERISDEFLEDNIPHVKMKRQAKGSKG